MAEKDGPTRKQLLRENARLKAELSKFKVGDRERREGEHWYELVEAFDANKIERVPTPKSWGSRAFLMGMIGDMHIVEVPQSAPEQELNSFLGLLRQHFAGNVLAVRTGVRFLKLRSTDAAMQAKLDEALRHESKEQTADIGEPDPRPGPELHGDGLGSSRSEG